MNEVNSYQLRYRQYMNSFGRDLWEHPEVVPSLEPGKRDAVIAYLLELACQSQNVENIQLGRAVILSLPHPWIVESIEAYAEPLLRLDDEWEYRRLGELYERLDTNLLRRLAMRGLESRVHEIREAAQDFLEWLST